MGAWQYSQRLTAHSMISRFCTRVGLRRISRLPGDSRRFRAHSYHRFSQRELPELGKAKQAF